MIHKTNYSQQLAKYTGVEVMFLFSIICANNTVDLKRIVFLNVNFKMAISYGIIHNKAGKVQKKIVRILKVLNDRLGHLSHINTKKTVFLPNWLLQLSCIFLYQ